MYIFLTFVIVCGILPLLVTWLALLRNDWVYAVRIKMLRENLSNYDKLPSYDEMFFKFWVWDVNKFVDN